MRPSVVVKRLMSFSICTVLLGITAQALDLQGIGGIIDLGSSIINDSRRSGNQRQQQRQESGNAYAIQQPPELTISPDSFEQQELDVQYALAAIERRPEHSVPLIRHLKQQGNPNWNELHRRLQQRIGNASLDMPRIPQIHPNASWDAALNHQRATEAYAIQYRSMQENYYKTLHEARSAGQYYLDSINQENARREQTEAEIVERDQQESITAEELRVQELKERTERIERNKREMLAKVASERAKNNRNRMMQSERAKEIAGLEGGELYRKVYEQHTKVVTAIKELIYTHPIYKEKMDIVLNIADLLPDDDDNDSDFNRFTFHIVYKIKPMYQADVNADLRLVLFSAVDALNNLGYEPDKNKTPVKVVSMMTEMRDGALYGATFGEALYVQGMITPQSLMLGGW